MDTSFYGGRSGFSFIIVKQYASIEEMINDFKKGPNFTEVHYDEHVLINTENKNDPDNGKIFRRGYNYTDENGGAIYVGTIVGPAGRAPMLEMTTIDEVRKKQAEEGYDYRFSEGSYKPFNNLVPGKKDDGSFNDEIQWACCSVRNPNGEDTTAWIGFIFPFLVVDFTSESVNPYYHRSTEDANFVNQNLIKRTDEKDHPYFEKWHISVPKGLKGDTFQKLRVIPASDIIQQYDGKDDDVENGRKVLVYDYCHYDKKDTGEPVTLFLGDYNMIDEITLVDDGTFTINYSHDNDAIWPKIFKWIKSITLNTDTGLLQVVYNHDTDAAGESTLYQTYLTWVKDIIVANDGTITWDYTYGDNKVYNKLIKWIKSVTLDTETGHLTVIYNHEQDAQGVNTTYETDLDWVKSVDISEEGTITFDYTVSEDKVFKNYLKVIKSVTLNPETGELKVLYNQETDKDGNPTKYTTSLTWVKEITFLDDGSVTLHYTDTEDTTYENLIKWIKSVNLNGETGHLTILYNYDNEPGSDLPTKYDVDLRWVNNIDLAADGTVTLKYTTGNDVVLDTKIKWIVKTELAEDGTITITYNDDSTEVFGQFIRTITDVTLSETGEFRIKYNNGEPDLVRQLFWITNMEIVTGEIEGEGDQKLKITYCDGRSEEIGNPLNYIMRTAVTEDYHLLILHSDPARREVIKAAGNNYEFDGRDDWQDMGQVRSYDGVLIGLNIDPSEITESRPLYTKTVIEYLNREYPDGLTDINIFGKLVTVGSEEEGKAFYAFDYNKKDGQYKGWYYLGHIDPYENRYYLITKESDPELDLKKEYMTPNGIWFIVTGDE